MGGRESNAPSKGSSEWRRLTELHALAARRFEELFQGLPVACCTCDAAGTVFEANREFALLLGREPSNIVQRSLRELFESGEGPTKLQSMLSTISSGSAAPGVEHRGTRPDGTEFWAQCSALPLQGPKGSIVGAVFACADITERKVLEARIRDQMALLDAAKSELEKKSEELAMTNATLHLLASTDPLTGLANRRVFREHLDQEAQRATRDRRPLSVVMIDADRFKQYNDSFGHQAGDEVLRILAAVLKDRVRMGDIAARYGGEEFVIVLPRASKPDAIRVAERVRKSLESATWPHRAVTASFGAATASGDEIDVRALLANADAALYAAKANGRNRVQHWLDIVPKPEETAA